jgi:hypothetical protein
MALLLMEPLLVNYLDRANREMLVKHQCDLTLYELISQANQRRAALSLKVECSTKNNTQGRFTVTLLLKEWNGYRKADQEAILSYLGFTRKQLNEIFMAHTDKLNRNTDIIFGIAPSKIGKIYLDFDGSLVCYESSGKIKYYEQDANNQDVLIVKEKSADAKVIVTGKHSRCKENKTFNGYPVFWIAQDNHLNLTYYVRPRYATFLTNTIDLIKMFY